jgi:hypothetical protein
LRWLRSGGLLRIRLKGNEGSEDEQERLRHAPMLKAAERRAYSSNTAGRQMTIEGVT